MATPFDLLQNLGVLWPFLFVFVVIFGILSYTKAIGDNKVVHVLAALVIAIMAMFSEVVRLTVSTMAPWFVILFLAVMFLLVGIKMFGVSTEDIAGTFKKERSVWWIILLSLLIILGSLSYAVSQKGGFGVTSGNATTAENGEGQESAFWQALFHPKVLGAALILLIAVFTISSLTKKPT